MSSSQIKVFCVKNTDYAVGAWGATVESMRASRGGFGGWKTKLPKRGGVESDEFHPLRRFLA